VAFSSRWLSKRGVRLEEGLLLPATDPKRRRTPNIFLQGTVEIASGYAFSANKLSVSSAANNGGSTEIPTKAHYSIPTSPCEPYLVPSITENRVKMQTAKAGDCRQGAPMTQVASMQASLQKGTIHEILHFKSYLLETKGLASREPCLIEKNLTQHVRTRLFCSRSA
jgi:hypothetical protein